MGDDIGGAVHRGRPRDPRMNDTILAATRRLLSRDGYEGVSIDAIAREASVSRPTVYRRWPSKAHLVFAAVFDTAEAGNVLVSTGVFETDLRRFIRGVFDFWRRPEVAAATMGILADRHRDADLYIRTQQLLDERTRAGFDALVRDGIRQGVIAADVDVEMAYNVLVGTAFYTVHVLEPAGADDVAGRLCALLLHGSGCTNQREQGEPR